MMDPVKARNWALALTAIIAVVGSIGAYGKRVIAQEAGETAQAIVNTHAEVAEARLGQLVDASRRQEDRDLLKFCMDYTHQDQEVEVRHQTCAAESNKRWLVWDWEDCEVETPGGCGVKPTH